MQDKYFTSVDDFVKEAGSIVGTLKNLVKTRPWLLPAIAGPVGAGAGVAGGILLSGSEPPDEDPLGTGYGVGPEKLLSFMTSPGGIASVLGAGAILGLGQQLGKGTGEAVGGGIKRLFQKTYTGMGPDYLSELQEEDPIIAESDPDIMREAMHTMKRFAPSLATDKPSVRAFLREAATTGSGVNYNTVKLLAEAEQAAQRAGGGF